MVHMSVVYAAVKRGGVGSSVSALVMIPPPLVEARFQKKTARGKFPHFSTDAQAIVKSWPLSAHQ